MPAAHWSEILQRITLSLAAVIGGVWAVYRFVIERQAESVLTIDIEPSIHPHGPLWLAFIDVTLTNRGKSKLGANRGPRPTFNDGDETLTYAVGLQVRRVLDQAGTHAVNWYGSESVQEVSGIGDIDLATEYEIVDTRTTDFWMEPGESVHMVAPLILDRGYYMLKVTFLGPRLSQDFWSRIVAIAVPPHPAGRSAQQPSKAEVAV